MTFSEISLDYCNRVLNDSLPHRVASKLEKLACQRQLNDLARQEDGNFPYYFDAEAGDRHCNFMSYLPHVKGPWRGQFLVLEPHQVFMHHTLFAWKKKRNGFRRFTRAYWELPRKNGKSFSSAGIGLYMAFADGENGSEVYAGATTEKQAGMVFNPAWQMCKMTPSLVEAFGLTLAGTIRNPTSIYSESDMSIFAPVVGKPGDGSSVNCGICDEYHEHSQSTLLDTFQTGTGSRPQPIILIITTAGFDTSYPCYDEHLEAIKILEGSLEKDNVFPIIFGTDEDSDWTDFETWKTANPNYGVSIQEDSLRETYNNAIGSLKDRNVLLCKHLNMWMNSGSSWMDMEKWNACVDKSLNLSDFEGRECWVAVDLASKIDLCAVALLFKTDKGIVAFGKYYLPADTIEKTENGHYQRWVLAGLLTKTDGAVTDFHLVEQDLKELSRKFIIKELTFDPSNANYLIQNIQTWANFECVEFTQSPAMISEPMQELEARIYSNTLRFNGDAMMTWQMSNVVKKQARGGGEVKHYFPTKQSAGNKIDIVVAMVMALGRLMTYEDTGGAYEGRANNDSTPMLRIL